MNFRLNFVLLVIVAVLIGWSWQQWGEDKPQLADLIQREGSPEYTGQRTETMIYHLNGKPHYFAQADEIKHYESSGRSEFIRPLIQLFNYESAEKQWKLTAHHAEVGKDKMLHLSGQVRLENLAATQNTRLSEIETERLSINLTTYDIATDSQVKSRGMGFVTTGTGLVGNLKKQVATLTKDVKTYLEPTVINNAPEK